MKTKNKKKKKKKAIAVLLDESPQSNLASMVSQEELVPGQPAQRVLGRGGKRMKQETKKRLRQMLATPEQFHSELEEIKCENLQKHFRYSNQVFLEGS